MLHLAGPSPSDWIERAMADLPLILLDHAHCEKKAASTAMNLMFRYANEVWLLKPLSEVAREELEHFERVLDLLNARGLSFVAMDPSPYAKRLFKAVRRGEPLRMVDTLLCCSLIEARSCERMKLLSEHLEDETLAAFYKSLLVSEARHFQLYVELAVHVQPRDQVMARLVELSEHELSVLYDPNTPTRMHN